MKRKRGLDQVTTIVTESFREIQIQTLSELPKRHRFPYHPPRSAPIILGYIDPQGAIKMAETVLDVTPTTTQVALALGSEEDANGQVTTVDPLVSGSWSVDGALGSTVDSSADPTGLTATVTLPGGSEGTAVVSFSGTTSTGLTVTGVGQIVAATPPPGPPVTVNIELTASN